MTVARNPYEETKRTRWPTWAVEWRERITRGAGIEYERQPNWEMAKSAFLSRYPMREVVSVSRVDEKG